MNAMDLASMGTFLVPSGFINQLECLELPPDCGSYILYVMECTQEPFKLQELCVVLIVEPRLDRDSVVYLISKGVWGVVNKHGFRQVSAKNIQVLQIVPLDGQTGFTVEAMMNVFPL